MNQKNIFKLIITLFVITSCASSPPQNPDNICLIFEEKRSWYKAAIQTQKRWKLPPHVLMAVVYQESSFESNAKPEREKLLGFIPWKRPSSAKGYSQALTDTWDDYKDETEIQGLAERALKTLLILLVGMQVRDITKVLIRMMQDHFILPIMKVIADLKENIQKKTMANKSS